MRQAALLILPLVLVDAIFFSANILKLLEGAWVPLLFGIADGDADHRPGGARHRVCSHTRRARTEVPLRDAARTAWRRSRRTSCRAPQCS